jgi:hypothetical protein
MTVGQYMLFELGIVQRFMKRLPQFETHFSINHDSSRQLGVLSQ